MINIFIIAGESEKIKELSLELTQRDFVCLLVPEEGLVERLSKEAPDLVLVEMDGCSSNSVRKLSQKIKREGHLPVIGLVGKKALDSFDVTLNIDDFVVEPWDATEVTARVKQVLWRVSKISSSELIKCGDLVIDLAKYEVSLGGRLIALTFREYGLLKFLASNRGRVFSRETLLSKVWGYDYYGGDRTVDVHIRRLRSKVEDSTHNFIETVRNIGYKFGKEA